MILESKCCYVSVTCNTKISYSQENIIAKRDPCVLSEDLPITLEDVVICDAFPSEAQLAAILGHLMAKGLEHRSLECSSILIGLDGTVKIGKIKSPIGRWYH